MLIKICGMKEPGNVKEVAALHPDMLGFIFYKASPRYAGDFQRTLPYESLVSCFCSIPGADSLEGPGNRSTGIY